MIKSSHLLYHDIDGLVQHGSYVVLRNYVWHQPSVTWRMYHIKSQDTGRYVPFTLTRDDYELTQDGTSK